MQLVLSLVLEHADVPTLLDCLFLNKHIHGVVVKILEYELALIKELKVHYGGDIYHGIIDYVEKGICRIAKFKPIRKNIKSRLMTIYSRLCMFDVITDPVYYGPDDRELERIVNDFKGLIDKYYYKMSLDLIGIIFIAVCCRELWGNEDEYLNIAKCILNKGFNVNRLIKMDARKKTILTYAIFQDDHELIDLVLDKNPDVFMFDEEGNSADSTFPYDYSDYLDEYDFDVVPLIDKFNKIKKRQIKRMKNTVWI